jgi:hypothetical protein
MNVTEMLESLRKSGALEKVAAQGGLLDDSDRDLVKLSEDISYAGRLFGHQVVIGVLEKLAEGAVGATGKADPSQGNEKNDQSNMKRIADKIMALKGIKSGGSVPSIPGSAPLVRAETVAPPQATGKVNPDDKLG